MPVPRADRGNVEFFCAVVIVGLLAGVAGLATTFVLRVVQHATYHYSFGALLAGVALVAIGSGAKRVANRQRYSGRTVPVRCG